MSFSAIHEPLAPTSSGQGVKKRRSVSSSIFCRAVARLRSEGLIETRALKATAAGATVRQKIEDETDRLFFTPWPDDVGARSAWIAERLIQVNTALG